MFDVGLGGSGGKTSFEIHYVSFIAKLALTKVELFIPVLPFTSETQQRRDVIFVSRVFIFFIPIHFGYFYWIKKF